MPPLLEKLDQAEDGAMVQTLDFQGVKVEQFIYEIKELEGFLADLESFERSITEIYTNHHNEVLGKFQKQLVKQADTIGDLEDQTRIFTGLILGSEEQQCRQEGRLGDLARMLASMKKSRKEPLILFDAKLGKKLEENREGMEILEKVNSKTRWLERHVTEYFAGETKATPYEDSRKLET